MKRRATRNELKEREQNYRHVKKHNDAGPRKNKNRHTRKKK